MKQIISFLLIIVLASGDLLFGQKSWVPISSDTPQNPNIRIIEQSNSNVIIDIEITGFYSTDIEANDTKFQYVELESWQSTKDIGKPALPMINELIGVPSDRRVKAEIVSSSSTAFSDYHVFPFQTPEKDITGGQNSEFDYDRSFYKQAVNYPGENILMGKPGIWRDVKIAGLHITPFKYNPSLKLALDIAFEIEGGMGSVMRASPCTHSAGIFRLAVFPKSCVHAPVAKTTIPAEYW